MGKLFRYYNQNRVTVWILISAIAFIILIIHTLNSISREKNQTEELAKENLQKTETQQYEKQSQSMVSGDGVPSVYKEDMGSLIDNFLNYCKNHEPARAYGLLTQKCKDIMYQTEEIFENQYYKPKFAEEKTYSFQSWSSSNPYIYLVKIYPNMLATGKGNEQNYIQEYITAKKENDTYKLSVNSLVELSRKKGEATEKDVKISVESSEIYMDYEIVNIVVENNSSNDIVLDTTEETDKTYLVDKNNINYEARLFENLESDLKIEKNQKKKIQIKFNHPFQAENYTVKYVFSNVLFSEDEIGTIEVEV